LLEALAWHTGGQGRVQHAQELLQQDRHDAREHAADREVDLAFTDQAQHELAAIDLALQRLEAGGYGCCEDCGGPIALGRLQVQPQAGRCIACERAHERRHGGILASTL
jgi:RNA polymerase-binding protein DksA